MMSGKGKGKKIIVQKSSLADPPSLQALENSLDVRPFINQVEKVLNSDASSTRDDDSDSKQDLDLSKGEKSTNGVVTTRLDRHNDRLRLYNLASVGEERQWLRKVLISSSSDSSGDDSPATEDKRIKLVLKDRKKHNKSVKEYHKNSENSHYMYYGAGLLSTVDRYPARVAARQCLDLQTARGRSRGRPIASSSTRGTAKQQSGRIKSKKLESETKDVVDGVDWEEQLQNIKKEESLLTIAEKPVRGRKKLSTLKTPEALTARRKRHWQQLAKKELGKVQRARTAAHKEVILQKKRLATLCCKHWRHVAMQSQKNMKETVWRCKRLSREMQAYWRRYGRVERETRRRMEKEAEEQRKMDVELMEVKRQRRKLNFLITQTELYAHFMQKKLSEDGDNGADQILRQLDEDRDPRLASIDNYDSEAMKAQASRNAREAFRAERARTRLFDAATGLEINEENGDRKGDHDQPNIFRGTLKGYQLKGMNWLANLYDQGISGILADEMGLGKTVQCIAFLCHVAERLGVWGPFLVVSPASTLHNWQQEMERFVPDFKVVPYWGSPSERKILRQFWERKDLHTQQAAFHVVITSYQIVVSDLKYLNRVSWQYMILDEAQAIKSSASMRWKLLLGFSCRNRLLLSGTPIQNSMAELWALLHFIMPTLFDSHEEFNEWFSKDIESHAENKSTIDEKHLSRLHMILKPFMLRRIKKDVENELSDKIEIMVHCPLTIRQKLLYIALKKKIKIEELLHYSVGGESGHSVDKNFTSNLMNLVMQFRKVCNHPELFERRDVKSPFAMHIDDYHIPKIVTEECMLVRSIPSTRHILYNKLSILTPDKVHRSISNSEAQEQSDKRKDHETNSVSKEYSSSDIHTFTRHMDLSPMELYRVMLCGWLHAMQHIEQCVEKYERLRHREEWWRDAETTDKKVQRLSKRSILSFEKVRWKHMLLICPDGDITRRRKHDSLLWNDLLFTNPLWEPHGAFYAHTDHILHCMPETIEHRAMRMKQLRRKNGLTPEMLTEIKTEDGGIQQLDMEVGETPHVERQLDMEVGETPHVERQPQVFRDVPTTLPLFIYTVQAKVTAPTRQPFAVSRSFAYHVTRHQHGECREGSEMLTRLVAEARPPGGWTSIQVPDKNQLVSDAGKLTVLDSLLRRLKERGHRVLIYSQMTKMIDLLEEYMWHRKHKYMRLDGSSKISARRDMVADFQARADIFVFLLSTRAGGLGINLTAADTVIFYDSDWNPTVDQQAMDRAHRLGQTKQVTVYRLICKGTIEERIMQRAREKSEIQRMVISGGNFKPDTLKPKEVVSLLLDDEEIEYKYRQKSEEKKQMEEKDRKRKLGIQQPQAPPLEVRRATDAATDHLAYPISPLDMDEDDGELVVDTSPRATSPVSYSPPVRTSAWGIARSSRGTRRGRPRGPRATGSRNPIGGRTDNKPDSSPADNAVAVAAGAALLESDEPLDSMEPSSSNACEGRGRRGPGRPRSRVATMPRGPTRRPRRPREPLLVPLAPPP